MMYVNYLNTTLRPRESQQPVVLDLFAGCGGLALGFEAQGFKTIGFDQNVDACQTYNHNLLGHAEVATLSPEFKFPSASVVIGGPPCQPFSVIGNQRGAKDMRDGFPTFVAAVKNCQPEIFVIENVRGLFYRSRSYLDCIISELRDLDYLVEIQLLNAVSYEVPQNRERVIIVGHRGAYSYPLRSLRRFTAGDAIGDLVARSTPDAKYLTPSMDAYVASYEAKSFCTTPRDLHLDRPARTVTCRNISGATSDMHRVKLDDGRRRRLTYREAARLQSFPDWFRFSGSNSSVFDQIGNAVPPLLAYHIASSVLQYINSTYRRSREEIRDINVMHKGLLFA